MWYPTKVIMSAKKSESDYQIRLKVSQHSFGEYVKPFKVNPYATRWKRGRCRWNGAIGWGNDCFRISSIVRSSWSTCTRRKTDEISIVFIKVWKLRIWWAYQGKLMCKMSDVIFLLRGSRLKRKQNKIIKSIFRFVAVYHLVRDIIVCNFPSLRSVRNSFDRVHVK